MAAARVARPEAADHTGLESQDSAAAVEGGQAVGTARVSAVGLGVEGEG